MREGEKVNRKGRAFPSHCYPCGNDRFPMIRRVSCNKIPAGIFDPVPLYFDRNRPIVVEKFQRLFDWNPVPRNTPEHNETGRFWRLSDRFLSILAAGTIDLGFLVLFSSALCLFLISTIIILDQLLSMQLKSFCQTATRVSLLCIFFSFAISFELFFDSGLKKKPHFSVKNHEIQVKILQRWTGKNPVLSGRFGLLVRSGPAGPEPDCRTGSSSGSDSTVYHVCWQ